MENMDKGLTVPQWVLINRLLSGQNFSNFFVHILGNATPSYFHSEISQPLAARRVDFEINNEIT